MQTTRTERRFGLNHDQLLLLAMAFMLLDHLWATVISGQLWLTCVGRMAFPIFAFLIGEGYAHTHDWKKYAKRLFWFGVISEIPFNLMIFSFPVFPFHQNVMFTLLLGLLAIRFLEVSRNTRKEEVGKRAKNAALCLLCVLLGSLLMTDYGATGVLMVLLLWSSRNLPHCREFQLAGMVLLNLFADGQTIPLTLGSFVWEMPLQAFALLALVWIWLYNGQKGRGGKAFQYFGYAFYPVHMLVLFAISWLR